MSTTALSVPSQANAPAVATVFGLSSHWYSTEPSAQAASAAAAAGNASYTDFYTFDNLRTGWAAGGTSVTNARWTADPFDGSNSNAVLAISYPKDTLDGAQFSMSPFRYPNATVQTALLKYEVAFSNDLDFVLGGKLPGLYGATPDATQMCTGGKQLSDCFSARLMWRERGRGEVYAYLPVYPGFCGQSDVECNDAYGQSLSRGSFRFSRGGWTTITQLVALNTPGYANGLLYLWANDTLALAHTGLTWRTNASVTLTSVLFSTFFGGSGRQWESEGGEGYFRRFEVYGGPAQSNTSGPAVNATFEFTSAASRSHRPQTSGSPLLSFLASLALLVVVALQSAS
ncbi:uncharacterized protein JCM10292_000313 [Rhodotorula paludigena]|uniref:uncharacterized protein n=1 Tax=Rhodotorula paludigena TaxID=86838 RepID=UPI00316E3E1B